MDVLFVAAFLVAIVLFLIGLRRLVRSMPRESEREGYRRWRACSRKRAYPTQAVAQKVVDRHAREGDAVEAYHCQWCGRWHVGHPLPLWRR